VVRQRAANRASYAKRDAETKRTAWQKQAARDTRKIYARDYALRRYYGMSADEWVLLFAKQGERCAMCRSDVPRGGKWCVDHCHSTGKIRGILCHQCNVAIGMLGEGQENQDPRENALALVRYLNES
jgi:hypothetical protein